VVVVLTKLKPVIQVVVFVAVASGDSPSLLLFVLWQGLFLHLEPAGTETIAMRMLCTILESTNLIEHVKTLEALSN
jgi:hypothetical protein